MRFRCGLALTLTSRATFATRCLEGSADLKERTLAWEVGYPDYKERKHNVHFLSFGVPFNLLSLDKSVEPALSELVSKKIKPRLFIIDTQSAATPGIDENNNGALMEVMQILELIRDKFDCVVILLHHPPKAGLSGGSGGRGGGSVFGNLDFEIHVTKTEIWFEKNRYGRQTAHHRFKLNPVPIGKSEKLNRDGSERPIEACWAEILPLTGSPGADAVRANQALFDEIRGAFAALGVSVGEEVAMSKVCKQLWGNARYVEVAKLMKAQDIVFKVREEEDKRNRTLRYLTLLSE